MSIKGKPYQVRATLGVMAGTLYGNKHWSNAGVQAVFGSPKEKAPEALERLPRAKGNYHDHYSKIDEQKQVDSPAPGC